MNNGTFTYQVTKPGKVFLFWGGKQIKILDGNAAQKFLAKIDRLDEVKIERQYQLGFDGKRDRQFQTRK